MFLSHPKGYANYFQNRSDARRKAGSRLHYGTPVTLFTQVTASVKF